LIGLIGLIGFIGFIWLIGSLSGHLRIFFKWVTFVGHS
jgi:hypothetical protein